MDIKVNKIEAQVVEHFDPEGNSLGMLNEFESTDLRCQIAENKAEGYSVEFEGKRISINYRGEIEHWPWGLYDLTQSQFARLFEARGLRKPEPMTPEELFKEFSDLKNDKERWKWFLRNQRKCNLTIHLDNDDTYATMEVPEGQDSPIFQISNYIGWSDGIFELLEAFGLKGESV